MYYYLVINKFMLKILTLIKIKMDTKWIYQKNMP